MSEPIGTQADDDEQLDRLERQTDRLNQGIEGLTKALVDTAQVQARIAGLDERQKLIEDTAVPRTELDTRVEQVKAEQAQYRRKAVRRSSILGAIIVILVAGVTIAALVVGNKFSDDQHALSKAQTGLQQAQDRFANLQYTMCLNNNQAVSSLRQYLLAQRAATVLSQSDTPAIKTIKLHNFDELLKKYPQPTTKCVK